jgi:putative transcriptional regulator
MISAPIHHPAEDTLLRHAAGTLPPSRSLVIAAHLPFCPRCLETVGLGEAIGGALLDTMPESDLSTDALGRALARLDASARDDGSTAKPPELAEGVELPAALHGLTSRKWRWLAPGISRIPVHTGADRHGAPREHVYLLRIAPGTSLPDHGHHGWETTCVLAGSFTDASGEYGPGDLAETDGSVMHRPVAGMGQACICLIAWEGKLRMRGVLARLVQPLLGV